MFCVATRWLEKNASHINALNVFPVPDGDTGTNMLLTLRSTMAEAAQPSDNMASEIAQAMAKGALMGARGNSGVILSQIMKGMAEGLEGHKFFGPMEMAMALEQASIAAYKSLSKPREGTMLTVIKDVATKAKSSTASEVQDLVAMMEVLVEEARQSVERTPELLDVLREAGVVDAGGQGIYVILQGILHYLQGEAGDIELIETDLPAAKQPAFIAAKSMVREEEVYGYCTEFMIKGQNLDQASIREWVENKGQSVIVVGDANTAKIHVHTLHPGELIEFAISQGSVHDLKIENMDDQHQEFVQMRRAPMPEADIAVIAVAAGDGLGDVFHSLGTTAIIPGGQTMNPSCADILQAVDLIPSDKVIVLPNNKNVILAAKQATGVSKKKVVVLPTRSIPQGMSAMLAFNSNAELEHNLDEMAKASEKVKSIEVTRAVRDTKLGQLKIKEGDFIGLIDGRIRVSSDKLPQTAADVLKAAGIADADIVSIYYGGDTKEAEAKDLAQELKGNYPGLEVEVIAGGQPHYSYIMALE
jgi:DAK2 domain fusion protein YloV